MMFEELREKLNTLNPTLRFIIRLLYPITGYILFHFILYATLNLDLGITQFLFLILWGFVEWKLFLKR
jgi:hypothetical protein